MKKITSLFFTLVVAAFVLSANPVMAQMATDSSNTRTTGDQHDNIGKWGLLGLVGLAGLLGSKKKQDPLYTTTNNPNRSNV